MIKFDNFYSYLNVFLIVILRDLYAFHLYQFHQKQIALSNYLHVQLYLIRLVANLRKEKRLPLPDRHDKHGN